MTRRGLGSVIPLTTASSTKPLGTALTWIWAGLTIAAFEKLRDRSAILRE